MDFLTDLSVYTNKGYNISVLMYLYWRCWRGLCLGVQKKCYGQWNCCPCGLDLNFFCLACLSELTLEFVIRFGRFVRISKGSTISSQNLSNSSIFWQIFIQKKGIYDKIFFFKKWRNFNTKSKIKNYWSPPLTPTYSIKIPQPYNS
jgi:hypothetical protein